MRSHQAELYPTPADGSTRPCRKHTHQLDEKHSGHALGGEKLLLLLDETPRP